MRTSGTVRLLSVIGSVRGGHAAARPLGLSGALSEAGEQASRPPGAPEDEGSLAGRPRCLPAGGRDQAQHGGEAASAVRAAPGPRWPLLVERSGGVLGRVVLVERAGGVLGRVVLVERAGGVLGRVVLVERAGGVLGRVVLVERAGGVLGRVVLVERAGCCHRSSLPFAAGPAGSQQPKRRAMSIMTVSGGHARNHRIAWLAGHSHAARRRGGSCGGARLPGPRGPGHPGSRIPPSLTPRLAARRRAGRPGRGRGPGSAGPVPRRNDHPRSGARPAPAQAALSPPPRGRGRASPGRGWCRRSSRRAASRPPRAASWPQWTSRQPRRGGRVPRRPRRG